MNNEPPLVLISKQLLIVYEATTSWSREGIMERRELGKKEKEIKQEKMEEWRKEKQ